MARRTRTGPSLSWILFYGAIVADYVFFRMFLHTNYFVWYLGQGSLISISSALISTIVNDLDRNTELVSGHPRHYHAGCLKVQIMVLASVRTNLDALQAPVANGAAGDAEAPGAGAFTGVMGFLWDVLVGLVVTGVLYVAVLLWYLTVAPIQYVVFLVAGAPVRMGLGARPLRTVYEDESPKEQTISMVEGAVETDKKALDISFVRKPVTMTSAIAALLLWLANNALAPVL